LRARLQGDPSAVIPALWQRFAPHIGRIPTQIGAMVAYGLCLQSAPDGQGCDYVAGCEVRDFSALPADWSKVNIPAQYYAVFAHAQHASKLQNTIHAIFTEWLPGSDRQTAPGPLSFFERYGTGFNPQTGLGDIEVWLPIIA
jgi:AraC family transcriptional regulator